jgi:hypothetical protein
MAMGSVISFFSAGHAARRRPASVPREAREIRFRYPSEDELSEVSCRPEPRAAMSRRQHEPRKTRRTS